MNEAKVREIHEAESFEAYTYEQLTEADLWVKTYALEMLKQGLKGTDKSLRDYVMLMTRCHYGSVETDEFLKACECYPEWMRAGKAMDGEDTTEGDQQ